jgi:hypothetical protein
LSYELKKGIELMQHVIFNATNICSATWLEREEIRQIHILNNRQANIYLSNGEKVRITAEQIKLIMEERRKARCKHLQVLPTNLSNYLVRNEIKNTEYTVLPLIEHLECNCSDWKNQSIAFDSNQICCKHVFGVLRFLGFSQLSEYQEYVKEQMIARLEESKKTESEYLELENDHDYID